QTGGVGKSLQLDTGRSPTRPADTTMSVVQKGLWCEPEAFLRSQRSGEVFENSTACDTSRPSAWPRVHEPVAFFGTRPLSDKLEVNKLSNRPPGRSDNHSSRRV